MHLIRNTRGASLTDYGMLVAFIAMLAVSAVVTLGNRLDFMYRVFDQEIWMAMNERANFLDNGDFDNTDGMQAYSFGFSSGTLDGWVSENGRSFELHESGWQGMHSVNGGYWLDMGESPGPMHISQEIEDLVPRFIYKLTLFAGDRSSSLSNLTFVFWNGVKIGELKATQEDVMEEFEFNVEAKKGVNKLTLMEVSEGPNDNDGMSLDVVRIWGR